MPYIYVSPSVFAEIERRRAAVQTTAERVITAALEQTSNASTAQYYRSRFYLVDESDARWILAQGARERRHDDG